MSSSSNTPSDAPIWNVDSWAKAIVLTSDTPVSEQVHLILQNQTPESRIQELLSSVTWWIEQTDQGLFVRPAKLWDIHMLHRFLDRVFQYDAMSDSGWVFFCLQDIQIEALEQILYPDSTKSLPETIRIASGIRIFPQERKFLYRNVKPFKDRSGNVMEATYFFEKLEITEMVPTLTSDSTTPVVTEQTRPTTLDYDEFIAHLWRSKTICGIQWESIKNIIKTNISGFQTVAIGKLPQPGSDAAIKEDKKDMHKNRAPKESASGMFDFGQFTVSFPEVKKWEKILKKVPRTLGIDGRDVEGNILASPVPKDVQIAPFAWPGTKVFVEETMEYIVADMEWFLSVDQKTKTVSVTSTIVQKEAVAHKTTGNLINLLAEMEIKGGVEDGRILDGKGFTITGIVAAKLIRATEFDITINWPARNGRLEARTWNIVINDWQVTNETIYAPNGMVEIFGNVESGTTIYAKKVILHGTTFNSLIVADEIEMKSAISSQILGKKITIESLSTKHGAENIVFVEIPNIEMRNKKIAELQKNIEVVKKSIEWLRTETNVHKNQTPIPIEKIVAFLNALAENKGKVATMSEPDRVKFKAIMPYMEIVKKYVNGVKDIVQKETEIFEFEEQIKTINQEIQQANEQVRVMVGYVGGESRILTVRFEKSRDETLNFPNSLGVVHNISTLNTKIEKDQLIFDSSSGTVDWKIPVS